MATDLDISRLATLSEEEIAHTLRMNADDLAAAARTIAQSPRSTIEPAQRISEDALGRRAIESLVAESAKGGGILRGLDVERTIGEGGMGIVRLATQRSLGRKVAVKTLRASVKDKAATLRLLREAWVTGTLEHPNIVPVYDLGIDEGGSPIIVLKRIEGVEWAEIIHDEAAARARYGAKDLLDYNLRILLQLCNAVSLAHARGVLHRDLKPENVMIGSFGEVYLVDWGIAVSMRADTDGRLPLASEQNEMAGTPSYMAPEMLGGVGKLSERTDVYLLGAILHEILTGAPPHNGSFQKLVGSILLSTFTYAATVPRELAEIAAKAMARDPARRFASAEEVRQRIEWYLGHRGSLAISAEALVRLAEMRSLVASERPAASVSDPLYHLFAESRFGFRQALNASADNEDARAGLREAIEIIVRFELARGGAEAAAGALAELESPPAELVTAVAAARASRAADEAKMQRLEAQAAQLDPATGRRTRVAVASGLGIVWTLTPQLWGRRYDGHAVHPWWELTTMTMLMVGLGLIGVLWGRQSMMSTMVNRRMVASGCMMFGMQLAMELGTALLGLSWHSIMTLHLLLWGMTAAGLAMMIDRRFWVVTGSYVATFLVACHLPEQLWNMMSLANFVLTITFLVAWWRPREDRLRLFVR